MELDVELPSPKLDVVRPHLQFLDRRLFQYPLVFLAVLRRFVDDDADRVLRDTLRSCAAVVGSGRPRCDALRREERWELDPSRLGVTVRVGFRGGAADAWIGRSRNLHGWARRCGPR